jgi:hypothetical protein
VRYDPRKVLFYSLAQCSTLPTTRSAGCAIASVMPATPPCPPASARKRSQTSIRRSALLRAASRVSRAVLKDVWFAVYRQDDRPFLGVGLVE